MGFTRSVDNAFLKTKQQTPQRWGYHCWYKSPKKKKASLVGLLDQEKTKPKGFLDHFSHQNLPPNHEKRRLPKVSLPSLGSFRCLEEDSPRSYRFRSSQLQWHPASLRSVWLRWWGDGLGDWNRRSYRWWFGKSSKREIQISLESEISAWLWVNSDRRPPKNTKRLARENEDFQKPLVKTLPKRGL